MPLRRRHYPSSLTRAVEFAWCAGQSRPQQSNSAMIEPVNSAESMTRASESWSRTLGVPADLAAVKALVYDPCGFACGDPSLGDDNAQYGSVSFLLAGRAVTSRVAKLTPTKNGLFVAVWKRGADGATHPLDGADGHDVVAISVREGDRFGQFVFSREVLLEHDVMSPDGRGGKRGFRVYPPWVATESRQASATQAWQTRSFLQIDNGSAVDLPRALALYSAG
jgi:hypothetical protein